MRFQTSHRALLVFLRTDFSQALDVTQDFKISPALVVIRTFFYWLRAEAETHPFRLAIADLRIASYLCGRSNLYRPSRYSPGRVQISFQHSMNQIFAERRLRHHSI